MHADLLGSEGRAPVCFWSRRALFERELVTPHWASSRPPPNRARPFPYGVAGGCSVVLAGVFERCERVGRGRFVRRGEDRSQASARSSNCLSAHEGGTLLGWARLQFSTEANSGPSSRT